MKKINIRKIVKKVSGMFGCVILSIPFFCMTAFASQAAILQPINAMKTLIFAVLGAVGVIMIGFGVAEIATALSAQDSGQQASGVKKLVGGILLASISLIVTFLGFK